jgi:small subunit ribosomal protein S16
MIAIIGSMTKKERRNPDCSTARAAPAWPRARALTPADVNKLLKQYMQMEKMMGKLSRGGMKGMMRGMKSMMGGRGRAGSPSRPAVPAQIQQSRASTHMVKIRLTRGGAKKRPFYHIVVTDQRNKRDGRAIERVGFYNPVAQGNEVKLQLDAARVQHWIGNGAQLTDKVRSLVKQASAAPAAA